MSTILSRYQQIKHEIEQYQKGNSTHGRLMVVTKHHSADTIRPLLEHGHRLFGENKIQEINDKWPDLRKDFPDTQIHMIGALQSNKAADAIALCHAIHTVDREKLAINLAREMQKQQRYPDCFIQVNTGEEPQKSGILPHELADFLDYCIELKLPIKGLMAIPPLEANQSLHFALLHKLAKRHHLKELSMGMSDSYQQALGFGATYIRVGTQIMGKRSVYS